MKNQKVKKIKIILVTVFVLLFAIYSYMTYRANYLQTLEIGEEYLSVLNKNNEYKIRLFAFNFLFIFLVIYLNNIFIKRGLKTFFEDDDKKMVKLPNKSIAFIVSLIASAIITVTNFDKVVLFFNTAWFGINDPVFGIDIGFFLFQKPFIELVLNYFIKLFIMLIIYTGAYYIIVFNLCLNGVDKQLLLKSKFVKTLKVYALLIVTGFALKQFLGTYNIVYNEFITLKDTLSTQIIGAGLSDIIIKQWGYRILGIVMIISTVFILKYILNKDKNKKLLISICIVPGYLVVLSVIIIFFNLLFVNSNKLDKEKENIGYNIEYTKLAYNLNIEETEYETSDGITKKELDENSDILNNIGLIDEDTVLKTLNSLQTNSGYYTYRTAKLQKYYIDGQDTLVYVSPREIDVSNDISTYINKTYEYTHGFGSILTSVSKVDATGNIDYIQKSFSSENNKIYVREPRIYFGMQTNNAIITNSTNKSEFDYPITSTNNAEYTYNGKAGIKISFLDKLILSIMNKDVNITFSNTNDESKIILNRNIRERAKKIIPGLLYDEDPYLIISDEGKQIWVLDAYTISNEYPYSQRTGIKVGNSKREINYIRNSIKVLVDAYDGTIDFYITDSTDPIAVAYSNIYDGIFKDVSQIPNGISKYFVYPEFLYNVQSEILKIYHNVTEDVLYRGNDIWSVASYIASSKTSSKTEIKPYYTMIKDDNKNKIGLVLPYTVYGKQNINSYLIGTTDEAGKLKLKMYKYASGSNILGPEQLDKEIEQDERISEQIQSINVTGTKISKNIIIVPINNSLIYIEPIYQQQLNEKNSIPLLKKVVVASGTKISIGDNIKEALTNLFSQSAVDIKVESNDSMENLMTAIIEANVNLKDSTKSQNFEMIGKDITKLQNLIDQLEEQRKEKSNLEKNKEETSTTNKVISKK